MTTNQSNNLNTLKALLEKHGEVLVTDTDKMVFFIEACRSATEDKTLNPRFVEVAITGTPVRGRFANFEFTAYDNSKKK